MTISDWIQLSILAVYILQLVVLVLGYFGVIRETNKNARERQKAIDDAANTFQSIIDRTKAELNKMTVRNMVGMGAIAMIAMFVLFAGKLKGKKE